MLDPAATLFELTGPRPRVLVAYSGGVDSTVLTHSLLRRRRQLADLRLVHVDHGLQAASGDWARHCARQAKAWRLPLVTLRVRIEREHGESPEAAAREARYDALASVLQPGETLVTAQHKDDQVETLLLQLFRGAGVAGLAAMPRVAPLGRGTIVRPLLNVSRREIERYARDRGLEWVEDPTNRQLHFARNYLRAKVMPLIRDQWPGAVDAIARSARHMAEAQGLLGDLANRDLVAARDGDGMSVTALRRLPPARFRNALRQWIGAAGIEAPSTAQMLEMGGHVLAARADANPEVRWGGAVLRRRAGRLTLERRSADTIDADRELISKSWRWAKDRECVLNRAGDVLALVDDPKGPIDLDALPDLLAIRARAGGETLRLGERARRQSLKKLIQAARIPVDERARLPLIVSAGEPEARLLVVADRWIDASIAATVKSRRRGRLVWKILPN
jgi:tRNA(Ile)-lysidine synthase